MKMLPADALRFFTDFCREHMPIKRLMEYNDAYEVLRRLVVDDTARQKNQADTVRMEKQP